MHLDYAKKLREPIAPEESDLSRRLEGGLILVIACGIDYEAMTPAISYPKSRVVGIDYNPKAVEFAKEVHRRENLEFRVGDIYRLGVEFKE